MKREHQLPPLHLNWKLIQLKSGVWRADGRGNVSRKRYSLGTRDRDEAIKNLVKLDRQLAERNGIIPPLPASDQNGSLSIREACERFVASAEVRVVTESKNRLTPSGYRRKLLHFAEFAEAAGIRLVSGINDELLNRFIATLSNEGYAWSYVSGHADVVKMLVLYLVGKDLLPPRAQLKTRVRRARKSTRYCFERDEVMAVLRHTRITEHLRWLHTAIAIVAYTGMRITEAVWLRRTDIDFENEYIRLTDERFDTARVRQGDARTTKNGKDRLIPLHKELAKILKPLDSADGYFVHLPDGSRPKYSQMYKPFVSDVLEPLSAQFPKRKGEAKEFRDGRFHSFRHFFCSIAHDLGLSEQQVMEILGHSDSAMVRRYYHARPEVARKVLADLTLES